MNDKGEMKAKWAEINLKAFIVMVHVLRGKLHDSLLNEGEKKN
ncbi:hypothetical protein JCM19237_2765 [Photobacterium aphoticum]|uniref:Uncharacterized protein n=1 Tax=Photobacterium aphoticum TaxID=754436 RepID=A0A090QWM3_9GAMM|nr:hypothetical protein JCM19237_2765 [Photobacterium aphoticum]